MRTACLPIAVMASPNIAQVIVDAALFDSEGLSNLQNFKPLSFQNPCASGIGLGCAFLPSVIYAALLGCGDADSLPLHDVLMFDLGNAEQDARDQLSNRAAEIDLLGDSDNAHSAFTPVGHDIDTIPEIAGQPVELPDDNCVDATRKNGRLHFLESRALQMLSGFPVFKPLDAFVPVSL